MKEINIRIKTISSIVLLFIFSGFQSDTFAQLGLDFPLDLTITVSNSDQDCEILGDIPGTCKVVGRQVSNINCLSKTKIIEGDLNLRNTFLTNLDDLANLQEIGGDFYLQFNSKLTNLDGLVSLKKIGGNLIITGNHQLEECCILKPLVSAFSFKVKGDIFISNNKNRSMCSEIQRISNCK